MHTMEVGTANVPAFLTKLWKLVEDPAYSDLISWSPNGRSFLIRNPTRFSKELLPLYFKHNNMASFIRQLNMYGFRKLTSIENSGLRSERDEMEFYHQYFLKQQENLLEYIKRKASSSSSSASSGNHQHNGSNNVVSNGNSRHTDVCNGAKVEDVHELLTSIMQRQDSQENFRVSMQNEYSSLWKEIAFLRQQNAKQQTIVQRLIQFLMSLVQNQRNVSPNKRKATLMIDGIDGSSTLPSAAKRLNLEAGPSSASSNSSGCGSSSTNDRRAFDAASSRSEQAIKSGIFDAITSGLSNGPVIHDVTDDVIEADLEAAANSNPIVSMSNPAEADHPDPPAPLFQDIDLDILNQVLEFTSAAQTGDADEADCSEDGEDFPLDPEQLLALEAVVPVVSQAGSQSTLVADLVSGLLSDPRIKIPSNPRNQSGLNHHQQGIPSQASNYWPNYDSLPIPVVVTTPSPDPSVTAPDAVEPHDFLLESSILLEDKEPDLVLLPNVSTSHLEDGIATVSSYRTPSPYGLNRE